MVGVPEGHALTGQVVRQVGRVGEAAGSGFFQGFQPELGALQHRREHRIELPPAVVLALEARGWHFYKFIGEHGYRLMCSWATSDAEVQACLARFFQAEPPPLGGL